MNPLFLGKNSFYANYIFYLLELGTLKKDLNGNYFSYFRLLCDLGLIENYLQYSNADKNPYYNTCEELLEKFQEHSKDLRRKGWLESTEMYAFSSYKDDADWKSVKEALISLLNSEFTNDIMPSFKEPNETELECKMVVFFLHF